MNLTRGRYLRFALDDADLAIVYFDAADDRAVLHDAA
jgi:hypothetical protein